MISAFGVEHADPLGKGLRDSGARVVGRAKGGASHGNTARRAYKQSVHGLSGKAGYTVTRHPVRLVLLAAGTTGTGAAVKQRYRHEKGKLTDTAVKAITPRTAEPVAKDAHPTYPPDYRGHARVGVAAGTYFGGMAVATRGMSSAMMARTRMSPAEELSHAFAGTRSPQQLALRGAHGRAAVGAGLMVGGAYGLKRTLQSTDQHRRQYRAKVKAQRAAADRPVAKSLAGDMARGARGGAKAGYRYPGLRPRVLHTQYVQAVVNAANASGHPRAYINAAEVGRHAGASARTVAANRRPIAVDAAVVGGAGVVLTGTVLNAERNRPKRQRRYRAAQRRQVGKSAFGVTDAPKVTMPSKPAGHVHRPPKVSLSGQHSPAMTAPAAPGGLSKVKARLAPVPTPPTGP